MEDFYELLKISVPAALVLYAMYLTIKAMMSKELNKKQLEIRGKSIETVLPNRLQAYERICLFLERMSPNNLLLRLSTQKMSAVEFHQILLNEIREEYNHNVSQQVYMSDEAWDMVKNAKEELIVTINAAADKLGEKATSIDLSKQIFEETMTRDKDLIQETLKNIKNEIRQTF